MKRQQRTDKSESFYHKEDGQSIVLIAFILVGIIAFVGLATDAGLLFARSSQWSAAVDSAALAGVVDMQIGVPEAEVRAEQFLAANGWEFDRDESFGTRVLNDYGIPEFAFTATIPVETFFLNLIGFGDINLTHSATAAYYSMTDIPLPTQENRGQIREGSQFIFGVDACTRDGDPVSPRLADVGVGNPYHEVSGGSYRYRILIPGDYQANTGHDTVRVQLFDPDPHNNLLAGDDVTTINPSDGSSTSTFEACPLAPLDFSRNCVIEDTDPDNRNPVWLVRVDKIYEDDSCTGMKTAQPQSNNITQWRLFFVDDSDDEHTIASYTSTNAAFAATDLKWVTPGHTPNVPTDNNIRSFNVNIQDPLGNGTSIAPDEFGNFNIFLEVTAETGTSQNTWDLWAGPPDVADAAHTDVDGDGEITANDRNLWVMQNFPVASSRGVKVYAQGRAPISTYRSGVIKVPVAAVDDSESGLELYASAFDFDQGASGDPDNGNDLHFHFEIFGDPFPEGEANVEPICDGNANCDNKWISPQPIISIPINEPDVPPQFAFFGGHLVVNYTAARDEHVWSSLISKGTPFLTE